MLGFWGNSGNVSENTNFSRTSIIPLDYVPTCDKVFHSVVTWLNGTCNGQTFYADIANVPTFDRIAFNFPVSQVAVGGTVKFETNTLSDTIQGIEADISSLTTDNTEIKQNIEALTDTITESVYIVRYVTHSKKINPLSFTQGSYKADGTISTALQGYYTSERVPVWSGAVISYTKLRAYTGWVLIGAFGNDGNILLDKSLMSTGSEFQTGNWTVPSGVAYITLTAYNPDTANVNAYEVVIPSKVPISSVIGNTSVWDGKTAVIIGDSITAGLYTPVNGDSPNVVADPKYWETAGEALGLTMAGYGESGTSISRTSETLPSYAMSIRYADMINGADLIIVAGGTNDYGTNVVLGTIADQTDISFYGALNVLCDGLQTKYPGKRIVFITPIHRANEGANGAGATLEEYRQAIYDVARDVYGFAVIDGKTMGISCKNQSFKDVYIYDGLHPTQEGHNVYGQALAHALSAV